MLNTNWAPHAPISNCCYLPLIVKTTSCIRSFYFANVNTVQYSNGMVCKWFVQYIHHFILCDTVFISLSRLIPSISALGRIKNNNSLAPSFCQKSKENWFTICSRMTVPYATLFFRSNTIKKKRRKEKKTAIT